MQQNVGKIARDFRGTLVALGQILFECVRDDLIRALGSLWANIPHRLGMLCADRTENRERTRSLKRRLTGERFVKHHAKTPEIGATVNKFAFGLLGRHVERSANRAMGVG